MMGCKWQIFQRHENGRTGKEATQPYLAIAFILAGAKSAIVIRQKEPFLVGRL